MADTVDNILYLTLPEATQLGHPVQLFWLKHFRIQWQHLTGHDNFQVYDYMNYIVTPVKHYPINYWVLALYWWTKLMSVILSSRDLFPILIYEIIFCKRNIKYSRFPGRLRSINLQRMWGLIIITVYWMLLEKKLWWWDPGLEWYKKEMRP